MPTVSIIIPLYNKGPYVERSINSIIKQKFQDFEVIVVDGGSTDNGPEVISALNEPRIRMVQQKGRGLSEARNQGVEIARADLLAFLDADDEWLPTHLETIIRLREKYPEAGLYGTAFKLKTPNGKIRWNDYTCIPDSPWEGLIPNYFMSAATGATPYLPSASAVTKKIFDEVGGFTHGYGEDHDFFGKIALKYPTAFSWEQGAIYYQDAGNRLSRNSPLLKSEETFVKTARIALSSGTVLPEYIEPLNEYIYTKELWRAAQNVMAGNRKVALTILKQCKTKWHYRTKLLWFIFALLPHWMFNLIRNIKLCVYK